MGSASAAPTAEREAPGGDAARPSTLCLKDRDVQLVLACAVARFLSFAQLTALFFPTTSEEVARKRLAELCGSGRRPAAHPLLRRLHTVDRDLKPVFAFTPTDAGWALATSRLRRPLAPPSKDSAADFLLHNLGLAEVFAGLVRAAAGTRGAQLRPDLLTLPFLWRAGHLVYLPWHEDDGLGRRVPRVLTPDAVLDWPASPTSKATRYFIEFETGTHTIVPKSKRKRNATVTKAYRYGRFIHRESPPPYLRHFRDGLAAELVILSPDEGRARSVAAGIRAAVEEQHVSSRLVWHSLTVPTFLQQLGASMPALKPTTRETLATLRDVARRCLADNSALMKATRDELRRLNAAMGLSLPIPADPKSSFELNEVLKSLKERK